MFKVPEVEGIYRSCIPLFKRLFTNLNDFRFFEVKLVIQQLDDMLKHYEDEFSNADEPTKNDLFLLDKIVKLLASYTKLWEKITKQEFSVSWGYLQDGLDLLRILKKFLEGDSYQHFSFFEHQLTELEKLYPYNAFISIGATYKQAECNICGKDIDSFECEHIRGELYSGRMAHGIVHTVEQLDHVAIVTNPGNKRCVVLYSDDAEQFRLVRYLSELLIDGRLKPLYFSGLNFSKRKIKNLNYKKLKRNDICFCGSGKKFKNCCITKDYIDSDHVDILITHGQVYQHFPDISVSSSEKI